MSVNPTPQEIAQNHVLAMYRRLCRGVCAVSIAMPVVLIAYTYGCGLNFDALPGSMSAYYNTPRTSKCGAPYDDWARSFFVGFLFAIGLFLLIFPAYTKAQLAIKVSGLLALVIALFPTSSGTIAGLTVPGVGWVNTVHGISALIFFVPVGVVALFPQFDTTHHLSEKRQAALKLPYRIAGGVMVGGSVLIFLLDLLWPFSFGVIFWIEAVCVGGFAIFWWYRADEVLLLGYPDRYRKGPLRKLLERMRSPSR